MLAASDTHTHINKEGNTHCHRLFTQCSKVFFSNVPPALSKSLSKNDRAEKHEGRQEESLQRAGGEREVRKASHGLACLERG